LSLLNAKNLRVKYEVADRIISQHQQHNAKISLLHPSNIDEIDMTQEPVEKYVFLNMFS